jgi:hypothetical protein
MAINMVLLLESVFRFSSESDDLVMILRSKSAGDEEILAKMVYRHNGS